MSNVWGRNFTLSIFGESHGKGIGIVIGGLPAGLSLDFDAIDLEMARRAPGNSRLSTPRKERDKYDILSGIKDNVLTGAPLCAVIKNENTRSRDYTLNLLRPGHADFTALMRYGGHGDMRGGGHFSGRLTAPLVFAGAVARQALAASEIEIGARILSVSDIEDSPASPNEIIAASRKAFPTADDSRGNMMQKAILKAKSEGNSLGGVIQCTATGIPPGWGNPFFTSVESTISAMMFSIPAVKGIEFGEGFALSRMTGYDANDSLRMSHGRITLASNKNGGVSGGISNGQPIQFNVCIRPTPTIAIPQKTVDIDTMENTEKSFQGRHDPCIVPRAVPVIEAALALCLLDFKLDFISCQP